MVGSILVVVSTHRTGSAVNVNIVVEAKGSYRITGDESLVWAIIR